MQCHYRLDDWRCEERENLDKEDLCIAHSKSLDKDYTQVNAKIDSVISQPGDDAYDFKGWVIRAESADHLGRKTFKRLADFSSAEFHDVRLQNIAWPGGAKFAQAKFYGGFSFLKGNAGDLDFFEAQFHAKTNFDDLVFAGNVLSKRQSFMKIYLLSIRLILPEIDLILVEI